MSSVSPSLDDEPTCDHDSPGNITFAYSVAYFFSALFLMFLLDISPLGNKQTEKIGNACHTYWKTYEDDDEDEVKSLWEGKCGRMVKRAKKRLRRGCKRKMTMLVKPDKKGRDTAYLSKLLQGSDFFMGDNGSYFENGVTIYLCCCCKCRFFSFHFPPGLIEDFYYYVSNNHAFLSVISAEPGHPFRRIERNFSFLTLGSLTFFGVVGASFIKGTSQTNTVIFQVALGVANFMLTNIFQVLFACTCLFSPEAGASRRNALMRCCETSGTVLGCILALILSVGMLLAASLLCGDGGVALVTFVVRSQIPSIGIGVGMIYRHYVPYVLHLSDLPLLGDMTVLGSWYLDKFEASNDHKEEWAQENPVRHIITRQHFRFLEINFKQYCCPLIPYFTTDTEFDPDSRGKGPVGVGEAADKAEDDAAAKRGGEDAGTTNINNSAKIHPLTDKKDIPFDNIEERQEAQ